MSDVRPLIEAAIRDRGSEAKLAKACGVSQAAINKAKLVGRCSPNLAVRIERACGISRRLLCPEFFRIPGENSAPVEGAAA
jgi:DNA-binding transcriptional regulator YdaS (Cro superfamily)